MRVSVIAFVADATPQRYVVQLHSGGAPMQVYGVDPADNERLHCWWFNIQGEVIEAFIPRACLRVVRWRS